MFPAGMEGNNGGEMELTGLETGTFGPGLDTPADATFNLGEVFEGLCIGMGPGTV